MQEFLRLYLRYITLLLSMYLMQLHDRYGPDGVILKGDSRGYLSEFRFIGHKLLNARWLMAM